ncbi:aminopeptidase P family protein [Palleronia sediminis]|uniref:Aminopeptidase P family protein n=1 Tax=Palleronia sediminis TaxID=2547833 RepID=A0A4R6AD63_9RHOB|nr:aminopeptidase P family protein [Palleronia sediminis]TDL81961.1 aminopeptidase P family protein [Palleronia sediminis]
MFQSFTIDAPSEPHGDRIARLREGMRGDGLDAFLVPRADAFQGEYVAPCDARLAWLTGFTGSAGIAAVTGDAAALFVDGRYTIQGREQAPEGVEIVDWPATRPGEWLAGRLARGARVGFDPWLHTRSEIDALEKALGPDIAAVPVGANPVDAAWPDRPAPPRGAVTRWPDRLAGRTRAEKTAGIAADLRAAGQDWAVLSLPDSIAWLLNIRGSDIPRNPVPHGFAILEAATGGVRLFIDAAKLDALGGALKGVAVFPPDAILSALAELSGTVRLDPDSAPHAFGRALEQAGLRIDWAPDPCLLPKARKTDAEIAATTQAHLRDAAAMCRFLHWLDGRLAAVCDGTPLTEIDAVRALEGFRVDTGALRDISFETIAGAGPNGALPHYRVSERSNRALAPGELLLIDSGGQYEDGTTDITRTFVAGRPDDDQIDSYTRVLKGLIALSRARFPRGLAGRDLDPLARAALWRGGKDYAHGTGHGVGVYLSVHEGPQSISRRGKLPLEPGMIVSNEPGHYVEGRFGVRLENLIVVVPAPRIEGGDAGRDMLAFETLTWVPFERRLIDVDALSPGERAWIDAYHQGVAHRMTGRLPPEVADWLGRATRPL